MPALSAADGAAILKRLNTMQNQIDQLANQIQTNYEETTQALAVLTA